MANKSAFNHAAQIDLFYQELRAGLIAGVAARPALTSDVHALYVAWCTRRAEPPLQAIAYFVKLLVARHPVHSVRKRYAVGMSVLGPHGILYLAPVEPARRGYEADWLGEHVTTFGAAVAVYRSQRCASREVPA